MSTVDKSSPLPAYSRWRRTCAGGSRRASGGPATGSRPELSLARDYGVSRVTVRQALAELAKDDLVERQRGSGTYVRPQQRPIVYDLNLTLGAYAARIRELGFTNRAEILESGLLQPPRPSICARRWRCARDGGRRTSSGGSSSTQQPAAMYRSWFDASVVPGIERRPGADRLAVGHAGEGVRLRPGARGTYLEVVRSTGEEAVLAGGGSDVPLLVDDQHQLPRPTDARWSTARRPGSATASLPCDLGGVSTLLIVAAAAL